MTIGTLIAFSTLQATLFRPIMGLLGIGAQWVTSTAVMSRVFGYLDLKTDLPEPDPAEAETVNPVGPATLSFHDVTLVYPGAESAAVTNVSFDVGQRQLVALVGETGSGKSTIAALADRLMDPTDGTVRLNGHDLRRLRRADITATIGIVSQETYLVHDTVRANLALGRAGATDAEMWSALETARVADTIAALPRGLDTLVGARGHRFSGGEQQRLVIARTILADPSLLILDEATSALDNRTESEVYQALDHLTSGRTTLVIAHRLTTITKADEILVLGSGRILERGTHAELLERSGEYAQLWNRIDAHSPSSDYAGHL